ncbi:Endopolyphosphatase, partial [Rhizophlyctis rosea]
MLLRTLCLLPLVTTTILSAPAPHAQPQTQIPLAANPAAPYPSRGTIEKGKFLHITDIHIDPTYLPGSNPKYLCHRKSNKTAENTSGKFGALGSDCDSPVVLVDAAFDFIKKELSDEIDFVIYTGDTARHDRDDDRPRTEEMVLADHAAIVERLKSSFDLSKVRIFPTIGNNDVFTHDQMPRGRQPLTRNLTLLWEPLNLSVSTDKDFQTGGYYARPLSSSLTLISLNTMHLYKNNALAAECSHKKSAGAEMLRWLEKILKQSKKDGGKVYIIGHVPPHNDGGSSAYHSSCYEAYLKLLGKHYGVIAGHFFGHTNDDTISYLYTRHHRHHKKHKPTYHLKTIISSTPDVDFSKDEIVHVLGTAPSVIPFNNPGVRVYDYIRDIDTAEGGDGDVEVEKKKGGKGGKKKKKPKKPEEPGEGEEYVGKVVDYTQFWADLEGGERRGSVEFGVEY